jgi:hypothetical protein
VTQANAFFRVRSEELGPGPWSRVSGQRREAGLREIKVSKLLRACGGCLGAKRRRRTWVAAKSSGELPTER